MRNLYLARILAAELFHRVFVFKIVPLVALMMPWRVLIIGLLILIPLIVIHDMLLLAWFTEAHQPLELIPISTLTASKAIEERVLLCYAKGEHVGFLFVVWFCAHRAVTSLDVLAFVLWLHTQLLQQCKYFHGRHMLLLVMRRVASVAGSVRVRVTHVLSATLSGAVAW